MKNEYSNAMSNNPSLSDQRNQISLIHLFKRFCICKVANVEAFGMAIMHHRRQLCTSAMRGEIFQIFKFCTYDIVIQIGSNSFNYQSLVLYSSCYTKYRMFGYYSIKQAYLIKRYGKLTTSIA